MTSSAPQEGSGAPFVNTGHGPRLDLIDVGLDDSLGAINPDTAFWSLVPRRAAGSLVSGSSQIMPAFARQEPAFRGEIEALRFQVMPSAVYLNPTDRCNLNCDYCYLPDEMRRNGDQMTTDQLDRTLAILKDYFTATLPEGVVPQAVFHGSEPLLAREAVFAAIERHSGHFRFGVQTNATLLDKETGDFLISRGVSVGLSLDAHRADLADAARKRWNGDGCFGAVREALERLIDYPPLSVICTVTRANVESLAEIVEFFHRMGVRTALLNPVRITREGGKDLKPDNALLAREFIRALDKTWELYQGTKHKLVVANFANVLTGIVAPTARRLMCDISPCGGGRCFFAVDARGEVFPCSEFIGLPEFRGGNLFTGSLSEIIRSDSFRQITGRKVEDFSPCAGCAIRNFCGAPCPAEIFAREGRLNAPSVYCEFYEEQVRYAFRVIAAGREDAYLWDGWREETVETFSA